MSETIDIEGKVYISTRRAAEISGYARDYIGQLARKGLIEARRVGGLWYVVEESMLTHKDKADSYTPSPPSISERPADPDSLISFDGKDYVSSTRAALLTGYHQDYVGQLAREGKILSRHVGNRWYVDRDGILAHKEEKDALLRAVQAESVGVKPIVQEIEAKKEENPQPEPFLTYFKEEKTDLMPEIKENTLESIENDDFVEENDDAAAVFGGEEEHIIPIRKMYDRELVDGRSFAGKGKTRLSLPKIPRKTIFYVVICILVVVGLSGFLLVNRATHIQFLTQVFKKTTDVTVSTVEALLTRELVYIRSEN